MVEALGPQRLTVLFCFCDEVGSEQLVPSVLVKRLICQMLAFHPELVNRTPRLLNLRRMKRSMNFDEVWHVFETLISRLEDIFIVIDRIEKCIVDDQIERDAQEVLLKSLGNLALKRPNVQIILTSIYEPPSSLADQGIYSLYIDTGTRAKDRK